jgi:hypothetical protein
MEAMYSSEKSADFHRTIRRHISEERTLNKHKFLKKKNKEELIAYFPLYDTDRIENDAPNNSSLPRERLYRVVT